MNVAILYFSGTGGTAKVASDLAAGFRAEGCQVELFRLKRGFQFDLSRFDLFAVGSPAYSFRIPRLVSRLLRRHNFHRKPFFVFCTSGGMPGNTLWNLFRAVKRTAGVCLGGLSIFAMTNLRSWMPKEGDSAASLWRITDHDTRIARATGKVILERLQQWQTAPSKKLRNNWKPTSSLWTILWSALFTWRWMMAATAGIKRIDKDRCNKCSLCATTICPSGAISISDDGWPKFNECKCVGCNGCLNLCPQDAIWSFISRHHQQYDLYKQFILKK